MEFEEYRIMFEAEDTHWWYRGLRGVLLTLLKLDGRAGKQPRILDAGCGTGGGMQALISMGYRQVEGFDFSPVAIFFCKQRGLHMAKEGSMFSIPYGSDGYDIAVSCDVLNDAGLPTEMPALEELYRVLRPGGRLFLNLPAFGFLRGEHDRATAVARRYTRRDISRKLRQAGFHVERVTYWNMLLFPVVLAVRLLRPGNRTNPNKPARSDIQLPPAPLNTLLTLILRLERAILQRVDLPFGSSVAVVARKPVARKPRQP